MSAKKIALDLDTFAGSVASLQKDLKTLQAITVELDSRSSKSDAMDAFDGKLEEIKKLISRYESLLESDIEALKSGASAMQGADAAIAAGYGSASADVGGFSKNGGGIR